MYWEDMIRRVVGLGVDLEIIARPEGLTALG